MTAAQLTPEDAMPSEDNNKVTLLASVVTAVMQNLETVKAGMYRTPHVRDEEACDVAWRVRWQHWLQDRLGVVQLSRIVCMVDVIFQRLVLLGLLSVRVRRCVGVWAPGAVSSVAF